MGSLLLLLLPKSPHLLNAPAGPVTNAVALELSATESTPVKDVLVSSKGRCSLVACLSCPYF